jgi:hypothetical protein
MALTAGTKLGPYEDTGAIGAGCANLALFARVGISRGEIHTVQFVA